MQGVRRYFDQAFGRYALTSALATATDFTCASGLHAIGAGAALATFLGCVAGGVVAFAMGRRWTFRAEGGRAMPQIVRFLCVWAASALLNASGVPALLLVMNSFSLAWVLTRAAVYLGWNYPMSRWFVFGARSAPRAELSAP
jgi:putative flippase GtrA